MLAYHVPDPTLVQFSLWEFRAAIHVAEQLGTRLELAFGYGGEPMFVRLHVPGALHAEFILATTGEEMGRPEAPRPTPWAVPPERTPPAQPEPTPAPASPLFFHDEPAPKLEPASHALHETPYSPPTQRTPPRESTGTVLHSGRPGIPLSQLFTVQPTPADQGGSRDEHPSSWLDAPPSPPHVESDSLPPTQPPRGAHTKVGRPPLTPVPAVGLAGQHASTSIAVRRCLCFFVFGSAWLCP